MVHEHITFFREKMWSEHPAQVAGPYVRHLALFELAYLHYDDLLRHNKNVPLPEVRKSFLMENQP
jgi:hypothetical protein